MHRLRPAGIYFSLKLQLSRWSPTVTLPVLTFQSIKSIALSQLEMLGTSAVSNIPEHPRPSITVLQKRKNSAYFQYWFPVGLVCLEGCWRLEEHWRSKRSSESMLKIVALVGRYFWPWHCPIHEKVPTIPRKSSDVRVVQVPDKKTKKKKLLLDLENIVFP